MIGSMKLRTYTKPKPERKRKRKKKRQTTSNRFEPIPEILQEDLFDANDSIRSDIWQDSFDKFVGSRTPLRKDNLIKKVVRAEYNANSSVENVDDSCIEPKIVSSDNVDRRRLKVATISTPLRLTCEGDLFSIISPIVPVRSQSGTSNTRDVDSQIVGLNSQSDENQLLELTDDFHLISTNDTVGTGSARGYNSSSNSTPTRIFAGQNNEIQDAQVQEVPERGKKRKLQRGKNRVQTRRGQGRETDKDLELLARKVVEDVRTKWDDIPLPNPEEVEDCTGADCSGSLNVPTLLEQEQPKYSIRNKWKQKIQEYTNDDSKKRPKCKDYLRIETGIPNETDEPPVCYDEEYLRKGIEFFQKVNKSNNGKKTQQKSKQKPLRTTNQNVNTSEKSLPTFLIEDSGHGIGMSTPLNAHSDAILSITPSPSIDITTNLELDNETERCIDRNIENLNCLVRKTASGLHSNMRRKGIIVGASFDTSSSLNSGSNLLESRSKNSETLVEQTNSINGIDQRTSTLSNPLLDSMLFLPGSLRRVDRSTPQNSSLRSMNLSRGLPHISSDSTPITKSCVLEMNHVAGVTNNYALPSSTPVCETIESIYQNQSNELNSISNQSVNTREHNVSTFQHTNDSLQVEHSSAILEKPKLPAKRARKKRNLNVASQTIRYNLRNRKEGLKITSTPSDAMSDLRDFKHPSTDTDIIEINADENEQRVEGQNNPLLKSNPKDSLKRLKNSKASPRPMRYNLRRRNIRLEVNPISNSSPTVSDLHSVRIPSTDTEIFDPTEFKNEKKNIRLKRLQASKLNLKTVSSIPSEETVQANQDVEMASLQSTEKSKSMQNLSDCDMDSVSSKTFIFDLSEEISLAAEHVPPADRMVNHSAPISFDEENVLSSKTVTSIPFVQRICDNKEVCTAKRVTDRITEETSQACEVNPRHIEVEVIVQNVAPPDAAGSESDEPDPVVNLESINDNEVNSILNLKILSPVPREQRISEHSDSDVERLSSNTAMFQRTEETAQGQATLQSTEKSKSMQNLSDCEMDSVSSKTSIFDRSEEISLAPEHVPPPDQMVNHSAPISLDKENVLSSKTVTSIPFVQRICDNQEVCTAKRVTERITEEKAQACEVNPRHIEVEVIVQNVAPPDAAGSESDAPDPVLNLESINDNDGNSVLNLKIIPPVPRQQRISKHSDLERISSNTAMFERTEETAQASGVDPVHVQGEVLIQNVPPTDATESDGDANSSSISLDEITIPLDISNKNVSFEQVLKGARELSMRCRKEAALALQKKRLDSTNIENSTKTGDSNLDGTIDKESFFNTISERTTNLAVTQSSLGSSCVGRSISGPNLLPHNAFRSPGASRTSRNPRKSCLNGSNSLNLPLIELKGGKWRRKLSSIRKSRDSSSRHSKQFDNVFRASAGAPNSVGKVTAKQASKNLELSGLMEASCEFSLLIEPTDDETPKLLSSALLDNPSLDKRLQKSLQLIETTTKPTAATRNPVATAEFKRLQIEENISRFNESTGERRRTYQQQLSTPYFNRETSVLHQLSSRRRRTSFIEDTQISGRNPFNQLGLVPTNETSLHAQHHLSTRDVVLRRCGQSEPIDFVSIYSEEDLQNCRKIGEGVYGEVFMNKSHQSGEAVVLKIIPIEGSIEVNGEPQKKFDEILSEIIIAMELSKLRNDREYMTSGFVEVKNVRCVQGRYPEYLIDLWELYRDNYGTENDHPEIFTDDQLFIVLELANGGQDLEAFTFHNAMQSYSAFLQTAITLAVAENKFQFEHRDLHWGNILLKPTDEKIVKYIFKGSEIKVPTHGVKVTIIDYTLSRMIFDTCCLFNDLSNDDELFSAGGDYQFDIYRLMRERLENNWEVFEPYTNVLWLHYTVDKMISGARYQNTKTKKHRTAMNDIMKIRDELLDFKSASDYIESLY